MFTKGFDSFTIDGERISCTVDGFTCYATTERDDNGAAPDERAEGFWPSKDPESAGYVGAGRYPSEMAWARKVMQAWKDDEWDFCGVCVWIEKNGIRLTRPYDTALWGIERNYPVRRKGEKPNAYLREVANGLLPDALDQARDKLAELCHCEAVA